MSWLGNTAEGGSDTVAVLTTNSGGASGTAFGTVTIGTGAITFSATQKAHGSLSYKFVAGSASGCNFTIATATSTTGAMRYFIYLTAYPTSATQLARFATSGSLVVGNIVIDPVGHIALQGPNGTLRTGTTILSLNTWYRLELGLTVGTATTGVINMSCYALDSMTIVDSYSSTTADLGTTAFTKCNFGKVSGTGDWATFYIDDILINDASSTFPGPAAPAVTIRGVPSVDGAAATTTATSRTPTITTGTAVGELMIAACSWSGSAVTLTAPAGWTLLHNTQQTNENLAVYYRYFQAGDANPVFTLSAACTCIAACTTLSGAVLSGAPVKANVLGGAASTTVTYPAITPANATDYLLYIVGFRPATASAVGTLSTLPAGGTGQNVVKFVDGCTNVSGSAEAQIAILGQQLTAATAIAQQTSTDSQSGSGVVEALSIALLSGTTYAGASTMTSGSTFGADASRISPISAGFTSGSAFTASPVMLAQAAASMTSGSAFTATPVLTALASATWVSGSAFTAVAGIVVLATASWTSGSVFTAGASRFTPVSASWVSGSVFTATAVLTALASATWASASIFTAATTAIRPSSANWVSVSLFTASTAAAGSASFISTSVFTAAPTSTLLATATWASISLFNISASGGSSGAATLTSVSLFTAGAGRFTPVAASFTSISLFTATGARISPTAVTFVSTSIFAAAVIAQRPSSANWVSTSSFAAVTALQLVAMASMQSMSDMGALGIIGLPVRDISVVIKLSPESSEYSAKLGVGSQYSAQLSTSSKYFAGLSSSSKYTAKLLPGSRYSVRLEEE